MVEGSRCRPVLQTHRCANDGKGPPGPITILITIAITMTITITLAITITIEITVTIKMTPMHLQV